MEMEYKPHKVILTE